MKPRVRKTKGQPDKVDLEIGRMIRLARQARGISQEKLGKALGLTFQQVQKYEKGTNCVKLRTALKMCAVLGCHMGELVPVNLRDRL